MDSIAQLNTSLAGRYEVDREIGRGGMAAVYLARDVRHDRLVALKLLNPELGAVLGVERFLSEIKVTANLHHPHLLPLFDSGEASGLLFYVMPYVDGESLRARLEREKQLPTEEAIAIALAVASALEYAHAHGVIHRDLKPENILLQGGQAVVADFGIALAVSNAGGARVTQTGLSLGTPQYMSPEQATGDRVIDRRSDIYSLAAVTYEMLTGEPPHTGNTMQAVIARVLTERPRSVRVMRPNVPEHVEQALARALEKLPADRWPSAHEFAEALQGRMASTSSRATPAVARGAAGSRSRDPLVRALAAAAFAAVLFGGWQWRAAHRAPAIATVRFTLTLPASVRASNANRQQSKLAISPDGRLIAFIGTADAGTSMIYVRAMNDVNVRAVAGTEGARTAFFSPDGKWLGFWTGGVLMKVPVDLGTPLPLMPTSGTLFGESWSINGTIVVSVNQRLMVIPEGGGTPRLLTKLDPATSGMLEVRPLVVADGNTVVYSWWASPSAPSARIAVVSLKSGSFKVSDLPGTCPLAYLDGTLVYASAAGVIMAVPFDLAAARAKGVPVAVQAGVAVSVLTGAVQAAVSPSGAFVYRSGSLLAQLSLVDELGRARPLAPEEREYANPRFSPDGKKVAVGINAPDRSDIWVIDIATNTPTRLTTGGTSNERPEWTPDGKRVLYRTDQDGGSSIFWRSVDLSGPAEPLLSGRRSGFFEAVLSPDGRKIVYQLDSTGADVYYRAVSGDTTPKPIANSPQFVEDMPRVSPDGKWVAFVTDESGAQQVVVQPFPGPGARTQVSTTGGVEPIWSRDGHRIFFRDGRSIVAATVRADPAFSVTSRATLFADDYLGSSLPHSNFDASPDGAHLLLLKATGEAELQVVYNWTPVVTARLAGAVPER